MSSLKIIGVKRSKLGFLYGETSVGLLAGRLRVDSYDNEGNPSGYQRKFDKKRITEMLNNLIANSLKYGKRHGKTSILFEEMDDRILIEISDNGIGIAEKDLRRIFERFYRTDKSRSRDQGGTGLGLSIVKHIIEAHGQTISVRSKLGEGSTFSFTLDKTIDK